VSQWRVNERHPDGSKDEETAEAHSIRCGTRQQRHRHDCEHHLERRVGQGRHGQGEPRDCTTRIGEAGEVQISQ
jgi:hypothetical protein